MMHDLESLARTLDYPQADACLAAFPGETLESLQELYTRTFDLNPVCSLEIGWHLFGEEYERGAFLVKMRQELRSHHVPESTELPDHLTHALRLLSKLEPEDAAALGGRFVLPAVEKMLAGLEGKHNPYEAVLRNVRDSLPRGGVE